MSLKNIKIKYSKLSSQWKINMGSSCRTGYLFPPLARNHIKFRDEPVTRKQSPCFTEGLVHSTWFLVWPRSVTVQTQKCSWVWKNSCSEQWSRCLKNFWLGDLFADMNPSAVTSATHPQTERPVLVSHIETSYMQYFPSKDLTVHSETLKIPSASSLVISILRESISTNFVLSRYLEIVWSGHRGYSWALP